MGLFDTPYIVNEKLLELKKLTSNDFSVDINILNKELFCVEHDYFQSPCYFTIISWDRTPEGNTIFNVKKFPEHQNNLNEVQTSFLAKNIIEALMSWDNHVSLIMQAESLYEAPDLNKMQQQFIDSFGLTEENANELLDDIQKKHATQYCDFVSEILSNLEEKDYDEEKIQEIQFDLDKIKRKINSLKIKTQGDLARQMARVFSKIKLVNVGKFIADKTTDGVAGKFIGDLIDKIGEL